MSKKTIDWKAAAGLALVALVIGTIGVGAIAIAVLSEPRFCKRCVEYREAAKTNSAAQWFDPYYREERNSSGMALSTKGVGIDMGAVVLTPNGLGINLTPQPEGPSRSNHKHLVRQ